MKNSFEDWMREVDQTLARELGMISDDLIDVCYRDWYDDGKTPTQAAKKAIRANKAEMGF